VLNDVFKGPTLIAFSNEHPGAAARIFKEFAKCQDKVRDQEAAAFRRQVHCGQSDRRGWQPWPTYNEAISQADERDPRGHQQAGSYSAGGSRQEGKPRLPEAAAESSTFSLFNKAA